MDWQTYEEVTKNIYETIGKESGVKIIGWGNTCKVAGRSTVKHQIDVLTSHSDGLHTYLTDIECKYWNTHIDKDIVMKVKDIVEDCGFNKGVIVSKLGFTPDAITFAKYSNIGLVILREPIAEDWENRVKTITFTLHSCVPTITEYFNESIEVYDESINGKTLDTEFFFYMFADGTKKTIKTIIENFYTKLTFDKADIEIKETINLPDETYLYDTDGKKYAKVKNIRIAGILATSTQKTEINAEDHVWLILKSLFDDKYFTISKDNIIRDVSE